MKRLLPALLLLGSALAGDAREGFGFKKKAVAMTRTIPPLTNAGARRVDLVVSAERGADEDDARTLSRYIGELILSGAGTLADGGKPEVIIEVNVDRLESHETFETYTDYERRQTGTKQEWSESKKKWESKPVYTSVAVQKQRKVLDAMLSGAFDISAKKKDVVSGQLSETFRDTYGDYDSAPSPTRLEDDLLKRAAKKIAAQIVPTQERVSILVPRASFEPLIPLAESGEWERYRAAVEAMPANRNQKDEAFRQYALAIAKEGLAYTKERAEALDLLRAAQSHYQTATALHPGEELFRSGYTSLLAADNIGPPITRATESVARFESWSGTGGTAVRVASATPVAGPKPAASSGMKNQTVIDLARAGLSDENIILAINGAAQTQFDVTPEGLITLSKAGVSKGVIAHMQKKR